MNIEKTKSEHAVSDILTPMLESQDRIVTEDVAPLFDQATGLDTPPASGTVTTTIEESRSVITAIIRKAWTATLTMLGGASVISYIAAAYTYLRNRLQGNETYGIPDRRSEISASSPLAANLALLNDRKIGGVPEAADGVSLVHLLHDTSAITELTDDNKWVLTKNNYVSTLASLFPAVTKMTLGITKSDGLTIANGSLSGITDLVIPYLSEIITKAFALYGWRLFANLGISKLHIPSLTYFYGRGSNSGTDGYIYNMANLTEIEFGTKGVPFEFNMRSGNHNTFICGDGNSLPNLTTVKIWCNKFNLVSGSWRPFISQCNSITTLVFDTLHEQLGYQFGGSANLIHLEFGEGTDCSIEFTKNWNPTNALDASRTDLIEEGSTAQNNLQQFLENFRDYIAKRLAKYTGAASGKPLLTLSQAVRNAIEADGIASYIKNDRNWEISPEPNNQ